MGFGSVWFVDFDIAHRELGIETMVSIEGNEILYKRAVFNSPYRTIDILSGMSYDVIPQLLENRVDLTDRPWIVWLDYDEIMDESKLDELDTLISGAPDNSIVLVTFNAIPRKYESKPIKRLERFENLFDDAFPSTKFPELEDVNDTDKVMVALSEALNTRLIKRFLKISRKGRFIPAFSLQYQDGAAMVTAGGVLADEGSTVGVLDLVNHSDWGGLSETPIVTPPLTQKETASLRTLLPSDSPLTRTDVVRLGFDLEDDQIRSFSDHYLNYPSFVQTAR